MSLDIPFNKPFMTGEELSCIASAHKNGILAGDGPFTTKCHRWLEEKTSCNKALLTHSCTAALEMSALLLDIQPGDEIIMPSYTFVSTANAIVLRGGIPVFVDIRPDTLNIDEALIEKAIGPKTKAVLPVHYAGVACEMDTIMDIARGNSIYIIEDAAQGLLSKYKGRELGSIGDLGSYSFHETKNIISGEGGALIVNTPEFSERAEIIREKGTDRSRFFRGQVDKYSWQDKGSSFLPGELIAAFLWAQLTHCDYISTERKKLWNNYHRLLGSLEEAGSLQRPHVPPDCEHNSHLYYIVLNDRFDRDSIIASLRAAGIGAVFHYIPLHSSSAGKKYTRAVGNMDVTDRVSQQLIRLPLWIGLDQEQQEYIVEILNDALQDSKS